MEILNRWPPPLSRRFARQPVRARGDPRPSAHVLALRPGTAPQGAHPAHGYACATSGCADADLIGCAIVGVAVAALDAVALAGLHPLTPAVVVAELLGAASRRQAMIAAGLFQGLIHGAGEEERAQLDAAWDAGRWQRPCEQGDVAARVLVDAALQLAVERVTTGAEASPLTAREREVLALVAHGLSDRAIAARLRISPHTASTHVKRVRAKLGGGSRAGIALHAFLGGRREIVAPRSVYPGARRDEVVDEG